MEDYAVGSAQGPNGSLRWPFFKWAGGLEDKYFARLGKNQISVYETPDMGLLDKKSMKLEEVVDFEWSPAEPLLAAYTRENANLPARIQLVKIPERTDVRQKNLFNVSGEGGCGGGGGGLQR
jgi:translation initiation factor 3 subunit B